MLRRRLHSQNIIMSLPHSKDDLKGMAHLIAPTAPINQINTRTDKQTAIVAPNIASANVPMSILQSDLLVGYRIQLYKHVLMVLSLNVLNKLWIMPMLIQEIISNNLLLLLKAMLLKRIM